MSVTLMIPSLSQRLAEMASDPEMAQDVSEAIRGLARRLATEAAEQAARDAEIAEWYRPATEAELADLDGIRYFLGRLFPAHTGPAALPGILAPVATRLIALGETMAADELRRAIAVSRTQSAAQAGLFIDTARGFIS